VGVGEGDLKPSDAITGSRIISPSPRMYLRKVANESELQRAAQYLGQREETSGVFTGQSCHRELGL
jgi:hypothetical protein